MAFCRPQELSSKIRVPRQSQVRGFEKKVRSRDPRFDDTVAGFDVSAPFCLPTVLFRVLPCVVAVRGAPTARAHMAGTLVPQLVQVP